MRTPRPRKPSRPRARARGKKPQVQPRRYLPALVLALTLAACARSEPPPTVRARPDAPAQRPSVDPRYGTSPSPRLYADGQPIPRGGGHFKLGAPYQIAGRWYFPREEPSYDRAGIASWYGEAFHGRKTANGEVFDRFALTAAHPTLPLPSYVWVTNESNGRTILVRVNDRGPYAHDRLIDLSQGSARALGVEKQGLARVRVRYAGRAPMDGDDRREQAHLRQQPWAAQAGAPTMAQPERPDARVTAVERTRWR
jgi:rare lipoprotein A